MSTKTTNTNQEPSLADAVQKRRWTDAEARVILAALAASGQSQREFGARHELDEARLSRWNAKFARRGDAPSDRGRSELESSMAFATVTASVGDAATPWFAVPTVTITVDAVRVDVHEPANCAAAWIAELVREVRRDAR